MLPSEDTIFFKKNVTRCAGIYKKIKKIKRIKSVKRTQRLTNNVPDTAKPDVVDPDDGIAVDAIGASQVVRVVVPRPAAQHALATRIRPFGITLGTILVIAGIVPIGAPLPDVARHIKKAIIISRVVANRA